MNPTILTPLKPKPRAQKTLKKPRLADATRQTQIPLRDCYTVSAAGHQLSLGKHTLVMGIVNATPDSFSHDGYFSAPNALKQGMALAQKQLRNGADIIDIGGESTRPGSNRVLVKEEIRRVIPLIEALAKKTNTPISVDTYKPTVARAALDAGACIVNNIMGTNPNSDLLKAVKNYDAAIVLMHIQGTPKTMQNNIHYSHLIREIAETLRNSIEKCLECGIKSDKIILDPGIGFGKTVEHNLEILNRLSDLKILKQPLLIGPSRKSFIGKVLNKNVDQRLNGTLAAVTAGILRGAHIVRAHDVRAVREAATMADAIINQNG